MTTRIDPSGPHASTVNGDPDAGNAGTAFAAQVKERHRLSGFDRDLRDVGTSHGYPRHDGTYQCTALDHKGTPRRLSLRIDGDRYALYDNQGKAMK